MFITNVLKRLLINILFIAFLIIAFITKEPTWFFVGCIYGLFFFLWPPILFWQAGQQRGKGSLVSARIFLFLDQIYPKALKSQTGVYFELAGQLFSQAQKEVSHFHEKKTQQEITFLRTAPEMLLAEYLFSKAQDIEKQFIKIDQIDRLVHQRNVAIADEELGYLYRSQHKFDRAIQCLENAVSTLQSLKTVNSQDASVTESLATSIFRLAEIFHIQGQNDQAIKYYNDALTFYIEVQNEEEIKVVRRFLGELENQ